MNYPAAHSELNTNPALAEGHHWTIVTQIKSNRVVYVTDDPAYTPPMDGDWYYCSRYLGMLPSGMSLANCWRWRFNGGVFKEAGDHGAGPRTEKLIDANRRALNTILIQKIDAVRKEFMPSCDGGGQVREKKIIEAIAYLNGAEERENYPFLQAISIARRVSLAEAANLVIENKKKYEEVLEESERFRELLSVAIADAETLEELEEIHIRLVDSVYPELLKKGEIERYSSIAPLLDRELRTVEQVHEKIRLKTLLREKINKLRQPLFSQYIQNTEIRNVKQMAAQKMISTKGTIRAVEREVLREYASARGISEIEAARILVFSKIEADKILIKTEAVKDRLLAKIERITDRNGIREIEAEINTIGRE